MKYPARSHDREFYWRQELMEAVSRWHDAHRIRQYLDAIDAAVGSGRNRYQDEQTFRRWFEWARQYADAIDPTMGARLPEEAASGPTNTQYARG